VATARGSGNRCSALGFDNRQIKADLERFKEFIEARGEATGAWRGTVEQPATS